ncbi:hypothetical protein [uncultured Methanomethylovorans sp.]|uniref:hypothetical protein n=1 Tax=uncultured Methanomethylovorans sp. TaxID=183759 RepID=UPI002AA7B540|nr:hypothetical protein [uncultured Methanomethylovorans sp.]
MTVTREIREIDKPPYGRGTPKTNYDKHTPFVLGIIQRSGPIRYSHLYNRYIEESGICVSKHTLNKCIEDLLLKQIITREEQRGRGNPVYFSLNEKGYKKDVDLDTILGILRKLLEDGAVRISINGQNLHTKTPPSSPLWTDILDKLFDLHDTINNVFWINGHAHTTKQVIDYLSIEEKEKYKDG